MSNAAISGLAPEAAGIRRRLLVVDDQPINIQLLYQLFSADHEVFMATSGRQALEVCARELPDLVLLDVVMPDFNGLQTCRELKHNEATRHIPVIFVTGQNSPEEETQGLAAGAVDFISKPINPSVVRARVKTHLLLKTQADQLRNLAFADGLTGLANRRRFDERLDLDWRACRRSATPLALILLDVDHFKRYNDHYGHQAGDLCLQTVARLLRGTLKRPYDLVARYGGEEFVCLLPGHSLESGAHVAEILRASVEAAALPHADSAVAAAVTLSGGVAAAIPSTSNTPQTLLAAVDERLYKAKRGGRNQVCAG